MADSPAIQVLAHPVTIQLGDRGIPVDSWPLPVVGTEYRQAELLEEGTDCLVLQPMQRASLGPMVGLLIPIVGGLALGVVILWHAADAGEVVIGGACVIAMLGFLALALLATRSHKRWVRFDRRGGQMTVHQYRRMFARAPEIVTTRPLRDIVCVQLLYGGFHSYVEDQGTGPGDQPVRQYHQYHSYQMNLVLDDPKEKRFNLTAHSDWQWLRQTGPRLAGFLGVPVLDQLYHGP
jgi:hypothetical protein